jgi:2-C-methyl-D-erythritol 4-phosphate cytidylyltransferase
MYAAAIILAAGRGERFGTRVSKPLVEIRSMPLVAYSLRCLDKHPLVNEIIVAVNAANREEILRVIERCRVRKSPRWSSAESGGRTR